jgi:tetratricopeptide (TPR) repeat protein
MELSSAQPPGASDSHPTSYISRGRAAYRKRRYAEAAEWFRRSSAENPSDPWVWIWLARALKELPDREGSHAAVQRALVLSPDSASARLHQIDLLLEEERTDLAGDALRELAAGSGREEWVARAVARRLSSIRDPHAVLTHLRPSERPGEARKDAERRLRLGDPAAAWSLLRREALGDADRGLLLRMARGFRRTGELTLALEVLDRAVGTDPSNTRIRRIRDRLQSEVRVASGSWSPGMRKHQDLELHPGRLLVLLEGSGGIAGSWSGDVARFVLPPAPGRDDPLDRWLELRLAEIVEMVRRARPWAILASRGRWTGLLALQVRKSLGTMIIYEAGDHPPATAIGAEHDPIGWSQACRWRYEQEQRLLATADLILVRTDAARDRYLRAGIGRGRIAVVPGQALPRPGRPPSSDPETSPRRSTPSSSWMFEM